MTQDYFGEITRSNERVISLVSDLLSVSRIDQGRVKNTPKLVDISEIVTDIVKQMQIPARSKEITLRLTMKQQKLPVINIDLIRLREVVENLIANAIEYTKTGGNVDVVMGKDNGDILLSVKDTGIGISSADLKKVFTKFFRSEKAVAQNPEGSGLGLYVVKSYVEGWGGKVSIESVDGKGSTFSISLPIKGVNQKEGVINI